VLAHQEPKLKFNMWLTFGGARGNILKKLPQKKAVNMTMLLLFSGSYGVRVRTSYAFFI
jgi:hypothetical protein